MVLSSNLVSFAICITAAAGHVVPNGDVDPDHDHTGTHGGEYPFHRHDPAGSHTGDGGRWANEAQHLREHVDHTADLSTEFLYDNLQTKSHMGTFGQRHGVRILSSMIQNMVPMKHTIEIHADANHPRDGTWMRGEYDKNDPNDPTTVYIRSRWFHHVLSGEVPFPPNPLEDACRLSNCLSEPNHENPDQSQCVVEGANIPYATVECVCAIDPRSAFPHPFESSTSSCNKCHPELGNDNCLQCRNSEYLYRGSCYASCPSSTTSKGVGTFNRRCEDYACIQGENSCNTCDVDNMMCTKCGDSQYLHNGECVATCPPDMEAIGVGVFNRECRSGCNTDGDCRSCNVDNTACLQCRNYKNLHLGACIDSCPSPYVTGPLANPNSQFYRECVDALPITPCVSGIDSCQRCDLGQTGDACTQCRNSQYLNNGTCIQVCPAGTTPRGTGRYNRFCEY